MKETRRNLTEGSIVGNIWHLALPLMVASALQDAFNIVDMIFVGRLGPSAIAAVSISGTIVGVVRMIAMGISTGTVAMVARLVGAGDRGAADEVIFQSLILSFLSSAVIAVLGYVLAEPVLRALGAAEDVIPDGVAYLRVMCLGGITIFLTMSLSAGLRGFGDAVTPMKALGLASILNIGLDPLLIFGPGPFPHLGVAGSAIATVIARGVGSALLLWALFREGRRDIGFGRAYDGVGWGIMGRIVRIGVFSSLQMLIMNVSRLVLVRIVAFFGTFAVAAYGIGMRLNLFVMMPGFGFGDAASVLVGQNLGASKPDRAEHSTWIAVGFYACFMVAMGFAFLAYPGEVIGIFNKHPQVVELGTGFLRFFAASLLFMDLSVVLGRALGGAGDTVPPMFIAGIALLAFGIPLAWGFSRLWGTTGVWAAISASNAIQGLGMALWFRMGHWKHKKI
ncbi:MAG: MATE family efflux transporter [bacterium]